MVPTDIPALCELLASSGSTIHSDPWAALGNMMAQLTDGFCWVLLTAADRAGSLMSAHRKLMYNFLPPIPERIKMIDDTVVWFKCLCQKYGWSATLFYPFLVFRREVRKHSAVSLHVGHCFTKSTQLAIIQKTDAVPNRAWPLWKCC